jgi:hypothetical protein
MRLTRSCAEAPGGRPADEALGRACGLLPPGAVAVAAVCLLAASPVSPQQDAQALFSKALVLERTLEVPPSGARTGEAGSGVKAYRQVIAAYEEVVRRYPRSGYSDDALWQAAQLALEALRRFGQDRDRQAASRLLRTLTKEYPASPFARRAETEVARLGAEGVRTLAPPRATEPVPPSQEKRSEAAPAAPPALLRSVRRTVMREVVRVTLELDREVVFESERIGDPPRVYIDLQDTSPSPAILEGTLSYADDVVKKLRVGRRTNTVTRVVLEIEESCVQHLRALQPLPTGRPRARSAGGWSRRRASACAALTSPGRAGVPPAAARPRAREAASLHCRRRTSPSAC